ncbi:MAG TPA: hypothetical protein VGA77_16795 [Propylenella sp.]
MATTTIDSVRTEAPPQWGFFGRLLERMAEGQMPKARAAAKPHLLALDDDALAQLGYRRDEIRRWESLSQWV